MPKREVQDFISHWSAASPSERANSQPFLIELCDLLDVPRPDPHPANGYFFEFPVEEHHPDGTTSIGRIDLYRRACFVLESKQFQEAKAKASQLELAAEETGLFSRKKSSQPVRGTEAWDEAMIKARGQAERYIRAIPDDNPPFIIVVDVGHSFELFEDFSQAGKTYRPFPDPRTFRIRLADLADEKIRERLRLIWTNPAALDPSKHSADVTREVSGHLAELAKSLELAGHEPDIVAQFLTRCLFCMFAEDVELLPKNSFTELLESLPATGEGFVQKIRTLFEEMQKGTDYSVVLNRKLLRFNGGLFENCSVLPINGLQLSLLKEAARQNWGNVEPAIFGTLLERALNPDERHQLGAHFTPRAYVERLVLPTVIEPLRTEWEHVRAAILTQARAGNLKKARAEVNAFHEKLCRLVVLDPACGVGNFLYVSLQHLKILEGEVLDFAAQFGDTFKLELATNTIDPHQFLGLEINPRAAAIAELVLWIGYLQWHFKLHGKRTPPEPILRAFKNIQCQDAILDYDGEPQPARDQAGNEITVWDRRGQKTDMVTGRKVPDETKRVPLLTYPNPKPAEWPQADFIVGNPPFIGDKRMREDLGDGYVEALRAAYPAVPESADFVLYWWHKAAEITRTGRAKRFGLITTNSLSQTFARRVVQAQLSAQPPLSLVFAIPDHPWVDSADGAAVRISMTTGESGKKSGTLLEILTEKAGEDLTRAVTFSEHNGIIFSNLSIGADTASAKILSSNEGLSSVGIALHALGLALTNEEAKSLIASCRAHGVKNAEAFIKPVLNGRDVAQTPRGNYVIDLFGIDEKSLHSLGPIYQWILERVKPERAVNKRASYRDYWWLPGEPRPELRLSISDIARYIVTPMVAKHRFFQFFPSGYIPDQKLVVVASEDAFVLGCLSSRAHLVWALELGSLLEDRPTYSHSNCFLKFPFPLANEAIQNQIRKLGDEIDEHRKQAQTKHGLTLTGLYNVLEKIGAGEKLTDKEKIIHDAGLVSVLKQLHDDLDAAVSAAYGWPATLTDAEILERLVALNAERAAEEKRGIVHWLRPEYQTKGQSKITLPVDLPFSFGKLANKPKAKSIQQKGKAAWPKKMAERVQMIEAALHRLGTATPAELADQFKRAKLADVAEILETLVTMGRARQQGGKFSR